MRLSLDFRSELAGVSTFVVEQFDRLMAQIKGTWGIEHSDDGHHTDITGTSLTVTGDVESGGDGTFAGPVSAEDGDIVLDDSAILGPGITIGNWSVRETPGFGLAIRDNRETDAASLYLVKTAGGATPVYELRPGNSAISLKIGTNSLGQRVAELNATLARSFNGYYERGRTVAALEWQTYTPVFRFGANSVTIGNGTIYGKYAEGGTTVLFRALLIIGSTTSFPTSGAMFVTLPNTAVAGGLQGHFGPVLVTDASSGNVFPGNLGVLFSATEMVAYLPAGTGTVSDTAPITLAAGDTIVITGFYEKA